MGAIADWAAFLAAYNAPRDLMFANRVWSAKNPGVVSSSWLQAPMAGGTPSTAVAPTKATTGAWNGPAAWQNSGGSFQLYNLGGLVSSNTGSGIVLVCDRLSHTGGLNGGLSTPQTSNLPTAALTRYTDGLGVWIGIEIYSSVGSSSTTITASYTNEAGTAGRNTPNRAFGVSGINVASAFLLLGLEPGDLGVKSVESIDLAASSGSAGDFGVTLIKPLFAFHTNCCNQPVEPFVGGGMFGLPEIPDDACLMGLRMSNSALIDAVGGVFRMAEV